MHEGHILILLIIIAFSIELFSSPKNIETFDDDDDDSSRKRRKDEDGSVVFSSYSSSSSSLLSSLMFFGLGITMGYGIDIADGK
tara:strand:- start:5272 stop:5523 length:252 start_codon:yes stop_codon:yes gene_type:complete